MDETFRLRLSILFFLSYSPAAPFSPCNFFNKLPRTSCLGYHLDFLLFKTICSHFSFVIQTRGIFFLYHHSGIVQCFVFLGFLTLLANFGLVTPIPDGIRVLGVKTPLKLNCSRESGHKTKPIPLSLLFCCIF